MKLKKVMYLAGLPRSGSTILSNLLGSHPEIRSTPSSPLCSIVRSMRKAWSDDVFLKSQLDRDSALILERLKRTAMATINAWSDEGDKDIVLDKNRGWLMNAEWLKSVDPNFKMIVTIRDLRRVFASIENQHRKTILLDFADSLEANIVDVRAAALFADSGILGSNIKAIYNIGDVPNLTDNLFIWRFEDFLQNPQPSMDKVFNFMGVDSVKIDFNNLQQVTHEADSYYNMKYLHKIFKEFRVPDAPLISPRILDMIVDKFKWFYDAYYPECVTKPSTFNPHIINNTESNSNLSEDDSEMIKDLEAAIKYEAM